MIMKYNRYDGWFCSDEQYFDVIVLADFISFFQQSSYINMQLLLKQF